MRKIISRFAFLPINKLTVKKSHVWWRHRPKPSMYNIFWFPKMFAKSSRSLLLWQNTGFCIQNQQISQPLNSPYSIVVIIIISDACKSEHALYTSFCMLITLHMPLNGTSHYCSGIHWPLMLLSYSLPHSSLPGYGLSNDPFNQYCFIMTLIWETFCSVCKVITVILLSWHLNDND